jgi:hypothetical protein
MMKNAHTSRRFQLPFLPARAQRQTVQTARSAPRAAPPAARAAVLDMAACFASAFKNIAAAAHTLLPRDSCALQLHLLPAYSVSVARARGVSVFFVA